MNTPNIRASSVSILFPDGSTDGFRELPETVIHDLGLDTICTEITDDPKEQRLILNILSNTSPDPRVTDYRQKVFADILALPDLRKKIIELFDRLEFIRNFGTVAKSTDEKLGLWYLLHRLDELNDYITCIEAMRECLSDASVSSEGLVRFRDYIDSLYSDACFAEMKKDIAELKAKSADIQSVTIGVNVNSKFEAVSMGLISVNSKPFKKSGIVNNFADALSSKNKIKEDNEWDGDMHYHQIESSEKLSPSAFINKAGGFLAMNQNPFLDAISRSTVVNMPDSDTSSSFTLYLDKVVNKILDNLIKRLRDVLSKYVDVAIADITRQIPEFIYYIRFAEYISARQEKGFRFCEARTSEDSDITMDAKGLYNLRLADNLESADEIVYNDLSFDKKHSIYILTGANRGGKTTITQAVGQLFVLAQGGISVPAFEFTFCPADCVFTHFPADEDKTMDLGRLGEECVRFRDIFSQCTEKSLVLLNETFSTTSFEEGCYIAKDSIRALTVKNVRTIYNTHMHKLAEDTAEYGGNVSSLIMKSDNGKRSFKIAAAPPEGLSYAHDIAEKYGVTFEMLTGK
ncbi:MAG: DNA mismatch repair protein [Ruminococcus sp.]|nr:DNA mismatch repair protein [Ruminococcus sp.]